VREPNLGNFTTSRASEESLDLLNLNNLNSQERLAIANTNEKISQTNIETAESSTSTPISQTVETSTSAPNLVEVATQIAPVETVDIQTETVFQKL
jgi:hypothetical protein